MVDAELNLQIFNDHFKELYDLPDEVVRKGRSLHDVAHARAEREIPAAEEMARIVQDGNAKILLNLQNLKFISRAGLRELLRTTKLLAEPEAKMMIYQAKGAVKDVLVISGFDTFIDVHDIEAAALNAF